MPDLPKCHIQPLVVAGAGDAHARFSWEMPRLSSVSLSEADVARTLLHSAVHTTLVPMMNLGESKAAVVKLMCMKLMEKLKTSETQSDVYKAAFEELKEISAALLALGDHQHGVAALDQLSKAKKGSRLLVKQTISQSSFWRNREISCRSKAQASKSLLPRVQALQELMKEDAINWQATVEYVRELPVWEDRLLPGSHVARAMGRG